MANWILFARDQNGQPATSAMQSSTAEKTLNGNLKANLIGFLNLFPGVGTFLVAKPQAKSDGSDDETTAAGRLPRSTFNSSNLSSTPPKATWFQFCRQIDDDQPVILAMDGATATEFYAGNLKQALVEFLNRHTGANTFQVASSEITIPTGIPEWRPGVPPLNTGLRVMLEVGHGPEIGGSFDPGAIAHDNTTTEHQLNLIAADAARQVLAKAGVFCSIVDSPQSNQLSLLGLRASGYDVFCSIHHNALRRGQDQAQGAEAFSHSSKGGVKDQQLAALISDALARTLNIPNRGAKTAAFGILSGAEETNVRAAVLAELYFIDFVGGIVAGRTFAKPNLRDMSIRGGAAIGEAILKWLQQNPKP